MGGIYESFTKDKDVSEGDLAEGFYRYQQSLRWEYGHGGYTGTMAEKTGLEFISGTWTQEEAREHCIENNEKWGRASVYRLDDGRWYVGGWCSS